MSKMKVILAVTAAAICLTAHADVIVKQWQCSWLPAPADHSGNYWVVIQVLPNPYTTGEIYVDLNGNPIGNVPGKDLHGIEQALPPATN